MSDIAVIKVFILLIVTFQFLAKCRGNIKMGWQVKAKPVNTGIEFELQFAPEPVLQIMGYFEFPNFIVDSARIIAQTRKIDAIKFIRAFYVMHTKKSLGLVEAKVIVESLM